MALTETADTSSDAVGAAFEAAPGVEVLMLDRPQRRNALDDATCLSLLEGLPISPPPERRCYLIYGSGTTFCAGADIGGLAGGEQRVAELLDRISEQPLPVVAWLNGPAMGAGAMLALRADVRVVSAAARLAIPAAKLGLAISPEVVAELVERIGHPATSELLLAARALDAETMLSLRIAIETAEAVADAAAVAARVAELAPLSIRAHRRGLQGRSAEAQALFEAAFASADLKEGTTAFFERRQPQFRGN